MTMTPFAKTALLSLSLLLAACASPVRSAAHLYRLTPLPGMQESSGNKAPIVIAVERPQAPAALETPRIALTRCATDFDYFSGIEWIDDVPDLFQRLVIESLDGQNGLVAMDLAHGTTTPADRRLRLDLRMFQAEYDKTRTAPTIHVRLNVKRLNPRTMAIEDATTLDATVPADANTQKAIVAAFNDATQRILMDIRLFTKQ